MIASQTVVAWLVTYFVHSTLLLGAAWGLTRLLRDRSGFGLGVQEAIWKVALVGGLVTATLQVGIAAATPAATPAAGVAAAIGETVAPHALAVDYRVLPPAAAGGLSPALTAPLGGAPAPQSVVATGWTAAIAPAPYSALASVDAALPGWQRMVLAAWLLGAALFAAGLVLSWTRLRLCLRRREELHAGPARRALDDLLAGLSRLGHVRLTRSSALPVPVALGVGEREICLPRRALATFDARQQEGLVAHELAHLARRDPAWLLASRVLESVLFFQPLNRLARQHLQEISELQSDAWAIRATGDRLTFARTLTAVAEWLSPATPVSLPAPGMARSHRSLGARVRHVLEGSIAAEAPAARRWAVAGGALVLALVVLSVPGLAPPSLAGERAAQGSDDAVSEPADAAEAEARLGEVRRQRDGDERTDARDAYGEDHEDGADHDADFDFDFDSDFDFDFDFDFAFDFDFDFDFDDAFEAAFHQAFDFDFDDLAEMDLPPEEMEAMIEEAMSAAMAAMPDPAEMEAMLAGMPEIHEAMISSQMAMLQDLEGELAHNEVLTPREREELRAELDRTKEEMRRATDEGRLDHEEMARALAEAREEMDRVRAEMPEHLRSEMAERRREMEEGRHEMERAKAELSGRREETRLEVKEALEEARRELREQQGEMEEARREIAEAHREIAEQRRELEEGRERLEEERREREQEETPPR